MFIAHTQSSVAAQTAHSFTLSKRNLRLLGLCLQSQEGQEEIFTFLHGLIKNVPPPYQLNDLEIWWTKDYQDFEDGLVQEHPALLDAKRISYRLKVATKRVKRLSDEERVPTSFSNPKHAGNPSNHCLPVLETMTIPDSSDHVILVIRRMQPVLSIARFRTIGFTIRASKRYCTSVPGFDLHSSSNSTEIAPETAQQHDDRCHSHVPWRVSSCQSGGKYNWSGRARYYSRTHFPPRYLLVDFGFSRIYVSSSVSPSEKTTHPISEGKIPGVEVIDPFPADVLSLGATIRVHILDFLSSTDGGFYTFKFLRPLTDDMTQDDPSKQPDLDEVVTHLTKAILDIVIVKIARSIHQ
ncbi:hypothetical protein C8R41DRAFT_915053 [Lentinula lateritia]|uniref:Uncharacterized protein n=1 Tax=Lentinula lateritia TaxID=40482 RepID=A0ABQ8VTQ1_9AGAR|nr:hypothetical protein C8R41DRAFT_915053 [Lentinula lateritia]